jgi:hypothetical protein
MSLKSNKTTLLISCAAVLLLIFSVATLFPRMVDNAITGMAAIASFPVSVVVGNNNIVGKVVEQEKKSNQHLTFFSSANRSFEVDTKYLNLTAFESTVLNEYILIRNPDFRSQTLSISFTNNFISNAPQNITIPANNTARIDLEVNTKDLEPGEYDDYVYIKNSMDQEKITVHLTIIKKQEIETGMVQEQPEKEQPAQIILPQAEEIINKQPKHDFSLIASSAILGTFVIVALVMIFKKHPKKEASRQEAGAQPDAGSPRLAMQEIKQDASPPVEKTEEIHKYPELPSLSINQQTSAVNELEEHSANK